MFERIQLRTSPAVGCRNPRMTRIAGCTRCARHRLDSPSRTCVVQVIRNWRSKLEMASNNVSYGRSIAMLSIA